MLINYSNGDNAGECTFSYSLIFVSWNIICDCLAKDKCSHKLFYMLYERFNYNFELFFSTPVPPTTVKNCVPHHE